MFYCDHVTASANSGSQLTLDIIRWTELCNAESQKVRRCWNQRHGKEHSATKIEETERRRRFDGDDSERWIYKRTETRRWSLGGRGKWISRMRQLSDMIPRANRYRLPYRKVDAAYLPIYNVFYRNNVAPLACLPGKMDFLGRARA